MELILLDTRTRIRLVLASCTLVGVVACLGHLQTAQAAFPSPPAWWIRDAHCLEHYESRETDDKTNPWQRGYLQFDWNRGHPPWGTWGSVGGAGDPAAASRSEQEYRGYRLWQRDGWSPWTTAALCGL